jgi:small subunit ribosomal protein S11
MGKRRLVKKTADEVQLKASGKISKEKLKKWKEIKEGRIYINCTYNNTTFTLTDPKGNVIYWTSAGKAGFSGTKKGTGFAGTVALQDVISLIKELGLEKIEVYIKGVGAGRSSVLKVLATEDLNIDLIKDITPIPHDGCRPPKVRRT